MISLTHESKTVITSDQAQRSDMDEKLQWCEQKGSWCSTEELGC